jgi:hypothetical protein
VKAFLLAAFLVGQEKAAPDASSAREQERVARLELEAARSKGFYFLADAATLTLALKLGGVPLATYQLESIELGRPLASADEELSLDSIYSCAAPPREPVEIVPGPPPAAPAPGTEEEEKPEVPQSAVLTCEPPLAVHLVSAGKVLGLRERVRWFGDRKDEPRVRLVVAEADADRLFSSLPEKPLVLFSRVPRATPESTTQVQ